MVLVASGRIPFSSQSSARGLTLQTLLLAECRLDALGAERQVAQAVAVALAKALAMAPAIGPCEASPAPSGFSPVRLCSITEISGTSSIVRI